jgi:hypothetical protein
LLALLGWLVKCFCVGSFVFKSGFFCSRISFCRPHGVAERISPPFVAPSKAHFHREGWRLRFFVKGDRPNTHSRAEKKDYENYITKNWFRAREPIRTVEQQQDTGSAKRS